MTALQNPQEFRSLLSKAAGASRILEIGSHEGGSLWELALAAKPGAIIRSIDIGHIPPGLMNGGAPAKLRQVILALMDKGYDAGVWFEDSHDYNSVEWAKNWAPYDLIHIDGDHSYKGVWQDWKMYGSLGHAVAFHDIINPAEEVRLFWRSVRKLPGVKEFVAPGSTMGIGYVPCATK
jgi:hypothetical protein